MVEEKENEEEVIYIEACKDGSSQIYFGKNAKEDAMHDARIDAKVTGGCRVFEVRGKFIAEYLPAKEKK